MLKLSFDSDWELPHFAVTAIEQRFAFTMLRIYGWHALAYL